MASEKTLATHTRKELAQIAKHNHVDGWHSMKKAELIKALKDRRLKKAPPPRRITERSQALKAEEANSKRVALWRADDQSPSETSDSQQKHRTPRVARLQANAAQGEREQLWATPQGSHWISASWILTSEILDRAEASLGRHWHQAKPMLRVFDVNSRDDNCPTICCVANIPIHGEVDYWYVPITDPSRTYELQIGYETEQGNFFVLARSAALKLPQPGTPQARKYEEQRQETGAQIAALDNLHRFPIRGAAAFRFSDDVSLEVEADLLVVGQVSPHAQLTCQEEKVSIERDGSFEIRLPLEDGRQVIPLEA
ncbi:MAG: DUF4912 domain-containing protein, partial [Planctomycetaceae bacterium]|nr:DUF4912 domain-containing protein [Planctomycetaceae bacterium]